MTTPPCPRCGQIHTACKAHTTAGNPCKAPPVRDMAVCRVHGGSSPRALQARNRRDQENAAREDAARFAARTDIHPADALLELVHYQAGIVDYWRGRVEDVEAEDLEWGVTREKTGGDDAGTTSEAAPHIAYRLLVEAQDKLAAYAAAALKAGVEQARVDIARRQGEAMAGVQRTILDRMLGSVLDLLRTRGVTDAEILDTLRSGWADAVSQIVPEELRRLAPGGAQ